MPWDSPSFLRLRKKLNEDGIPILRTILDCQRANDVFIEPDPVNLATVADMVDVVGWNGRDLCSRYGALITALRHVGTIGLCSHGRTVSESLVFSDAHVSGYGFVGGQPRLVYSKEWPRRFESRDMFFLEAIAAKQAVSALASNEGRIFLALDNKAVVLAIAKRS
eukprot:PhM_4_TR3088/c0_g3_i12/m.53703